MRFVTVTASALVAVGALATGSGASTAADSPVMCGGLPATIVATADNQTLTGTYGDDVISANGFRNIQVTADAGYYAGVGGSDVVCGGPGDDSLDARAADNVVYGGDGNDRIFTGGGTVYAGGGNDSIVAFNNGHLYGEAGDDHITVNANDPYNDTALWGGTPGPFLVDGGAGNDTTWMNSAGWQFGMKPPVIPKLDVTFNGGTGTDLFVLRGVAGPASLALHADLAKRTTRPNKVGVARWGPGTNRIAGTGYRDFFSGSSHRDYVDARGGRDVIRGYGGNDILLGGTGHDYVDGGTGRDVCGGEHKVRCERTP